MFAGLLAYVRRNPYLLLASLLYQQRKIVPATGTLLIAPTTFTHIHLGNRPLRRDKYIATSWVLFHRPEVLFGARKG